MAVALAAYGVVLSLRPHWWLYGLLGLLPLLNLYPWTGWLFVEEFDLAVLVTIAVGYWRASPARPASRITPLGAIALVLLTVSYLVSAMIPLRGAEDFSWGALASYNTPFNGLRVLKGWVWPLLLYPLLCRAADAYGEHFLRTIATGMLGGLFVASAVILWERIAFPGLLNFSTDYRAIGPFFEAHVGGAALDGYLALGMPFALTLLLRARNAPEISLAAALVMLATYASLATFSRGLYAGIAVAIILMGGLAMLNRPMQGQAFRVTAICVALVVGGLLLVQVFASGGYRTLAGALGTFAAAIYVGGISRPPNWRLLLGWIAGFMVVTIAFLAFVPKGAYIVYGASAVLAGAAGLMERLGRLTRTEILFALCAWLGINTVAIGWHWGGPTAMEDAAVTMVVAAVLALYNRNASAPLWSLSWRTASFVLAGMLLLGIAIPVVGNYYMKTRMSTVAQDLQKREDHWQSSIEIRGDGWNKSIFGAGLGTYPERYYWNNLKGDFPGSVQFMHEAGRDFVRLGQPRSGAKRSVEPLRFSQRIEVEPNQALRLQLALRSVAPKTTLRISVCEKWLLYTERCSQSRTRFMPEPGEWGTYSAELSTTTIGGGYWWGKRPALLSMAVDGKGTVIDVASVRLTDQHGRNQIANGDLLSGDHWYFTSDHAHLPWHAKNLWLGIWFDQGWLGLFSFVTLLTAVFLPGPLRSTQAAPYRTALLAAVAAFLAVGVFDTLLDATRLATVFYLLCFCALLVRVAGHRPETGIDASTTGSLAHPSAADRSISPAIRG